MREDIKQAIVSTMDENGKSNEFKVSYDSSKTMLQNARELLAWIKEDNYFRTLKLSSTKPELYDWSDDDSIEFPTEFVFSAYSSKGYDISAEIRFSK